MREHRVEQGEDLYCIARHYGTTPDALWTLADNEDLWLDRPNPNLLRPGDVVRIPEPEAKSVPVDTDTRTTFRLRSATARVRVRMNCPCGPLPDTPYLFTVVLPDGTELPARSGKTNGDGILDQTVPADAATARVRLRASEGERLVVLHLGHVDSPNEGCRGLQAMLNCLGYECGEEDDDLGEKTLAAVRSFQEDYGLPVLADDATEVEETVRAKVEAAYLGLLADRTWAPESPAQEDQAPRTMR